MVFLVLIGRTTSLPLQSFSSSVRRLSNIHCHTPLSPPYQREMPKRNEWQHTRKAIRTSKTRDDLVPQTFNHLRKVEQRIPQVSNPEFHTQTEREIKTRKRKETKTALSKREKDDKRIMKENKLTGEIIRSERKDSSHR